VRCRAYSIVFVVCSLCFVLSDLFALLLLLLLLLVDRSS